MSRTHLTTMASTSGEESLFERCAVENDGDQMLMLQCVTNSFESRHQSDLRDLDAWLLVVAGALVFFMQVCVCARECDGDDEDA